MATATLDWNGGGFSVEEEHGVIVSATRTALIEGITVSGGVTFQDEVYTALDNAGLTYYSTTSISQNLVLYRRSVTPLTENSNTQAIATLEYVGKATIPGKIGEWQPVVSATLSQVESAKDIIGAPITVSHTFPDDDENHAGGTITQGGTVQQLLPSYELTYRGLQNVPSILKFAERYMGRTNSATWNYGEAGKWLCTSVNGEPVDVRAGVDTWLVEITFQYRGIGWAQTVVFTDPSTGEQPANLVAGVGFRQVAVQPSVDFNDLILAS